MEILSLVILVVTGVLASSILERFIPRVSLPLVQVGLGVVWYFTPFLPTVRMDSQLFMVLFIAPLLFNAARSTTMSRLLKVIRQSLWLAIGLVFLCIVATGLTLHGLWPQIGLAAALALGAALAPTDAVAVTQMSSQARLTQTQTETLKGESLFNDAASIVSFEFAVVAATTGRFSPARFALEVVMSFVGGILFGLVMGWLIDRIVMLLRNHRLETTTNRITIEVLTPFLTYYLSERLGFSAVLSVVAAGLTIQFHRRGFGADIASVNLVSNSVWEFLEFNLNGAVFVLLGMQLPIIFLDASQGLVPDVPTIIAAALALTVVSLLVRFAAVMAMQRMQPDPAWAAAVGSDPRGASDSTASRPSDAQIKAARKERRRSALVMTFGGAKGAITISLAFTLPAMGATSQGESIRWMLWAIAAVFVIVSLVLTNIMLPLLAPRTDLNAAELTEAKRLVLNTTIERLAQTDTPETHQALQRVMNSYLYRIERLEDTHHSTLQIEADQRLRHDTLTWQIAWLHDYDEAHPDAHEATGDIISNITSTLEKNKDCSRFHRLPARIKRTVMHLRVAWHRLRSRLHPSLAGGDKHAHDTVVVHDALLKATISHLFGLVNDPSYDTECVMALMGEYRAAYVSIPFIGAGIDERERMSRQVSQVRADAFRIELEVVRDMLDEQRITREQAHIMRQNVHLMQADLGY